MRDQRGNRDFLPKYHDRNRRPDHLDSRVDAPRRHKPHSPQRLVALRPSPDKHRRSPPRSHRRDLMQRPSDHHKVVRREYPSPHRPRSHSPRARARNYHRDVHVPVPSYMHPDYPADLSHEIKHQHLGLDPQPLPGHKTVFTDDGIGRSYSATLKQDSFMDGMMTRGVHDSDLIHHRSHALDLYVGDRERDRDSEGGRDRERDRDRDRDKDRLRETGKGLYQREVPRPVTVTTTHLGPIDGGQSSYGHGRLRQEHDLLALEDISRVVGSRLPDDRRDSRDRVSDHYDNVVLDDVYGKMSYPTLGYSRADDVAYSARSVREGVFSGLPHDSTHKDVRPVYHGFEQACEARPLHRREPPFPFEGRHEFHSEVACATERETSERAIFPDHTKGLHHATYSPSYNGYADDLRYEPSHERLMAREQQLHHIYDHDHDNDRDSDHVIYDDSIFDDNDDDVDNDDNGDGYGQVLNQRITVKDRLSLSSQQIADVDRPIVRRAVPSRRPVVMHGKHKHYQTMSVPATMRTNSSIKKRLHLAPLDFRKENFRAHKMQRRAMEDKPNTRKLNYEYEKGSDEDAANRASPIIEDPPEGSEEFNKQVEKAFIKYTRIINANSKEKKKFLQPGKGSLVCCVCGRQSNEFAETHNLVVHTFRTRKLGLRTAHLGLHKALCLLMGWNWLKTPDESKQYQVGLPHEAKMLKQDLILWPPIVVICNSSIDNNTSESKTVSIGMIENMLKEIGMWEGKAKVTYGKPSNQSIILVKFSPMLSGFEQAEKLHNHFYQADHGKDHLECLLKSGASISSDKKAIQNEIEDVLYGYMAGIDDLEKLDSDTKKTYLAGRDTIRSKKVIKAVVNGKEAAA
ncbi:Protein SUPPRESSOR OF GENE SILENCING 3 [Rhynchospora pubera]|uniref:Protein SUPPRESSOR OF GENE SILENCING 3 n=1 Tax=Rhynchospora pubera TaxID=906938 RepID=A0AAV8HVX8_9POAL|nr:Protein SUPPRESSOR OF GENE SILENCING 3 [Rhynchospora pubera]